VHLFIELVTLAAVAVCVLHAQWHRGAEGGWLMLSALAMGFIREGFVVLRDYLYGYADLTLMIGRVPVIGAIIWAYCIYLGIVWAERVSGERFGAREGRPTARFLALIAVFLIALAGFFEPFLKLIDMARWQTGTWKVLDMPMIATIGYPSMTILFLLVWRAAMRATASSPAAVRAAALLAALGGVSIAHVLVLQALKTAIGW
jgi:hypothetical protein